MPLTANDIRDLIQRNEGTRLDFKGEGYSTSGEGRKNAELAKDIMAFANSLGPDSAPAHILIGVQKDKTICGVSSHPDDAAEHQKVSGHLNACPDFSYYDVEVDGKSVGVYEIRAGRRPFFPRADAPGFFKKFVPRYRDGSATDDATPTIVLEWGREDDRQSARVKELQLAKLEADLAISAYLEIHDQSGGPDGTSLLVRVWNVGPNIITAREFRWWIEWKPEFWAEVQKALARALADRPGLGLQPEIAVWENGAPPGYVSPSEVSTINVPPIPANAARDLKFNFSRAHALAHFAQQKVPIGGFDSRWYNLRFEVHCTNALGGEATLPYPRV